MESKRYRDADGDPISLYRLIRNEPAWAENQILHRDKLETELAEARAEIERLKCCTNCGSRLWAATGEGDCKNCKDFSRWTSQNKTALAAERGE